MASRASLNKVMLIGNLTRDPELRYTPQGNAVCTFGVATNRTWMPADGGERREETEFHRAVAWNKLAELCSQLLSKGRKVYVEGRLQTRQWQAPDGQQRQVTEIVIDDMRMLDSRRLGSEVEGFADIAPGEPVSKEKVEPAIVVEPTDEVEGLAAEPVVVAETPTAQESPSVQAPAASSDDGKKSDKKGKAAKSDKEESEPKKEQAADDEDILSDLPF